MSAAKRVKQYYSKKELLDEVLPFWTPKTLERRMKDEGFPFIKDSGGPIFDIEDVTRWLKMRKQNV